MSAKDHKKTCQSKISKRPTCEKLPWPGLKAKDHLSRVVTREVKKQREAKEAAAWAEIQIARVIDFVPPDIVLRLVLRELSRRRLFVPLSASATLKLLEL